MRCYPRSWGVSAWGALTEKSGVDVSSRLGGVRSRASSLRVLSGLFVESLLVPGLVLVGTTPSYADSAPPNPSDPANPTTVSSDALPTVQINGVVWAQVIVGNTVYAGGSFSSARPAGSAGRHQRDGAQQPARVQHHNRCADHHLRADGQRPGARHGALAGQVQALHRRRLHHHQRHQQATVAAFNTQTGALITTFNPAMNYHVYGLAVHANTVYVGGNFTPSGSSRAAPRGLQCDQQAHCSTGLRRPTASFAR